MSLRDLGKKEAERLQEEELKIKQRQDLEKRQKENRRRNSLHQITDFLLPQLNSLLLRLQSDGFTVEGPVCNDVKNLRFYLTPDYSIDFQYEDHDGEYGWTMTLCFKWIINDPQSYHNPLFLYLAASTHTYLVRKFLFEERQSKKVPVFVIQLSHNEYVSVLDFQQLEKHVIDWIAQCELKK